MNRPDISFTGSRQGPTGASRAAFIAFVLAVQMRVFRHGACVGWDGEAARIVRAYIPDCYIVAYPGCSQWDVPNKGPRPFRDAASMDISNEVKPEAPFFPRNKTIVDDGEWTIGCPSGASQSGTWHAINYANTMGKLAGIIEPDGSERTEIT